ncbi:oligoendopeptidase F [Halomarina ordinaria]|uniref:Oligoendopeptidase F n=1 Tax=Halomarina ordinaria TaxID=3033939 RepID=A0ABD5U3D2_9EURY|nr:oligoendopeptidase F [Halomarina sp. PSRA2]
MSSVPDRSEVPEEYTWDLSDIFASEEEWEAAFEEADERIDDLAAYEGRATEDATTLRDVLVTYEETMRVVSDVAAYARMRSDEDTRDQENQALFARAQSLVSRAQSASSYLEPELQSASRETIDAYVEAEPDLAEYDHYFDDVLRMKPHTRSAEVENLLAELGEVTGAAGEVYTMLTNADMEFPAVEHPDGEEVRITQSNVTKLLKHPDREFRQEVHASFYEEWETVRNAVGAAFKNSVKADVKLARARDYDTARAAALDGPNVPVEVYDTLVTAVRENIGTLHDHAELKREALDVEELEMWDLYAPIAEGESPEIPYEEAKEHIVAAVAPLGEDYQQRLAAGLDSRWVDVYENEGKRSGAYSGGTYDSQPYILMNYQDDMASMFTLAHELGHSLHSDLTSDEQPYVYSGYEIFVAEVASTVNEALLTHHLLETVEDEHFRQHLLDEYLERFRSTLLRQTMFAEFEHTAHELVEDDEPLTPDRLDDLYGDLKRAYYEPAHVDDHITREWMRIPHFYRAFYVYQYATGISAAVAIVDRILEEGEPAAEDYLRFLRSGSREYPLDLLREAGVDMSTRAPIETALGTYAEYVEEFARLT